MGGDDMSFVIFFFFSGVMLVLSTLQFMEKGVPLNNRYLYATPSERQRMDKKPCYRQSAIVFLLLGILFATLGLQSIFRHRILFILYWTLLFVTPAYAVASAIWPVMRKLKDNVS